MAPEAGTSSGYSRVGQNHYTQSALGAQLQIISLVEVARVPELNDHKCIVRFLFRANGTTFQYNIAQNPPQNVPTLAQIMASHARQAGAPKSINPSTYFTMFCVRASSS
jgi:hypothetical protein